MSIDADFAVNTCFTKITVISIANCVCSVAKPIVVLIIISVVVGVVVGVVGIGGRRSAVRSAVGCLCESVCGVWACALSSILAVAAGVGNSPGLALEALPHRQGGGALTGVTGKVTRRRQVVNSNM